MYTTIIHEARTVLKISLVEYCYCDLIYHMSNNPKAVKGWANIGHLTVSKILGITKQSVINMSKKLQEKELIETTRGGKLKRTTSKWYNVVFNFDFKINKSWDFLKCYYCDVTGLEAQIELDYFIPKAKGGTNECDNLVLCCESCMEKKGSMSGSEYQEMQGKNILPSETEQSKDFTPEPEKGKNILPKSAEKGKNILPNTNNLTNKIYTNTKNTLFPDYDFKKEIAFKDSPIANQLLFREELKEEAKKGIDIKYYYSAVKNWVDGLNKSDERKKKDFVGWAACVRNFIRNDEKDGTLKRKKIIRPEIKSDVASGSYNLTEDQQSENRKATNLDIISKFNDFVNNGVQPKFTSNGLIIGILRKNGLVEVDQKLSNKSLEEAIEVIKSKVMNNVTKRQIIESAKTGSPKPELKTLARRIDNDKIIISVFKSLKDESKHIKDYV